MQYTYADGKECQAIAPKRQNEWRRIVLIRATRDYSANRHVYGSILNLPI